MTILRINFFSSLQIKTAFLLCKKMYVLLAIIIIFLLLLLHSTVSASGDDYIRGYADAILKIKLNLRDYSLSVKEGVITLTLNDDQVLANDEIIKALYDIKGVIRVDVLKKEKAEPVEKVRTDTADSMESETQVYSRLKKGKLFHPLIADPRWPHFSIAYQYYIDDEEVRNVGATSFGETLPFYRDNAPFGGQWQIGIQAAVFAIFDLDADSLDLINADYWVGILVSYRKDTFSALLRLFHQSSHLGDEFLLRSRVDRVNLSYEAVDIKASYEPKNWLRNYGGATYIFHKEPSDLKPWLIQYGLELKSPKTYFGGNLTPVGGFDFKNRQESDWDIDISARAGFQVESEKMEWHQLHLMLEYFNGHSPHGQFYERKIEYWSLATHFYFQ